MASNAIQLSEPFDHFVDEKVRSGDFKDRTQVIEPALTLMQDDDDKLRRLRDAIQEGLDDFENGHFIEVSDVRAWLDTLGREP